MKISARYITDDSFEVILPFNLTYEQHHILTYIKDPGLKKNGAIDFQEVYLLNKNNSDDKIVLVNGGDERTPFNVCSCYIGAGHGQAAGVIITTASPHGKTPRDVGSRWKDSEGNNWNLLRIESDTELLFLSDFTGTVTEYRFLRQPVNNNGSVVLIHAGESFDKSDAVDKTDIVGKITTTGNQIYRAFKTPMRKIYSVNGGVRNIIPVVGDLGINKSIEADSIEIEEIYDIINPATIVGGLRRGRLYNETENPDIAVGEKMLRVRLTYIFENDGTVLTVMNHEAITDVGKVCYGGIQYYQREDTFNGGIYRYIPKTKPFTADAYNYAKKEEVGYQLENINVTTPYMASGDIRPWIYLFPSDSWENENNPPDREIQYFGDADTGKFRLAFAGGYLPVDDGRPEIRSTKVKKGAYFYYRTNKGYPQFVRMHDMKAGDIIKGVAYKKFVDIESEKHDYTSFYSIPYNGEKYYYIDYHKTGEDTIEFPENFSYKLVEKTNNVLYDVKEDSLKVKADCSGYGYGYIVLKAYKK